MTPEETDVIYCQDCGAGNDPGHPTCRICGRAMQFQPSTLRCSACREYVGIGAAFCSKCGASSDDIALGAAADGGIPPNEAAVEALLAGSATTARPPAPAAPEQSPENFNIGAGLDLPNWLKRAAAETPHTPTSESVTTGGQGRDVAARDAAGVGASAQTSVASAEFAPLRPTAPAHGPFAGGPSPAAAGPSDRLVASGGGAIAPSPALGSATKDVEPPLPPLPDGGLAATMPSWLRPGTGSVTAGAGPASLSPSVSPRPNADPLTRSLAEDPTDTTSFISEKDLPDWLRQLADADAARADEARRAEEVARLAAAQPEQVEEAGGGAITEALPAPDETSPVIAPRGAAGRWLSRRDHVEDAGSERRSAFKDLVLEQETVQDAISETAAPMSARRAADGASPAWAAPEASPQTAPSRSTESRGAKRWIVLGTLVLIIAALIAYLYASGQFG